jgi:16S rRNA (guanine527-N7)-methyltransferase
MTPEEFQAATAVNEDTLARLRLYVDLLCKWQRRINLIGPDTVPDIWRRHILDSAQLFPHLSPDTHRVADLGSGAGFPGLVLAVLGAADVHLIESDQRKAAFLREAARVTGTAVTIHAARAEAVPPLTAQVVTARALASLELLLPLASRHLAPGGRCLFLKGRGVEDELTTARKEWIITSDRIPSQSDPSGFILELREVRRGRPER